MTRALFSLFGPIVPRIGHHGDTALALQFLDTAAILT